MIKEIVCTKERKTSLTVTNSEISAVLRSNIQKTGIRLYENGCLGIAGAIGAYDDNELTNNAKHMLKFKLPYDCAVTVDEKRSVDFSDRLGVTDEQFVDMAERVLETLRDKYPEFMFAHKLNLIETEDSLRNDAGTLLIQKDRYVELTLLYKYRESNNLMDGHGFVVGRHMDFDVIMREMTVQCQAYKEKVDFSEENQKIPVVLLGSHQEFTKKFLTDLEGNSFGNGASIFSGKTGELLFSDKLSLIVDRNTEISLSRFFDGEGTVLPQDRFSLIENGVLKAPYADKRIAGKYGFTTTGSASLVYDSAPAASPNEVAIARSDKTIIELLAGRKAVYAVIAGGGDFTPQGEYASPIQVAFMYDGENYLGRLPQLSMSSNVYDMFGKDFIGVSSEGSYPDCPVSFLAIDMNVRKIDAWM